jgi:Basic region leucine zipper
MLILARLQEANRESAARSRDKRLKLIADLEVEVQQLKRQHAEFKVPALAHEWVRFWGMRRGGASTRIQDACLGPSWASARRPSVPGGG